MPSVISEFKGENKFLSNFCPCSQGVVYSGKRYPTAEHAYQAAKSTSDEERKWVKEAPTPGEAKKRGRNIKDLDPLWDDIRISVMYYIVKDKFLRNSDLKEKLLATADATLEEGNNWGDTFWGICNGKGKNNLGQILMKVREELCHT